LPVEGSAGRSPLEIMQTNGRIDPVKTGRKSLEIASRA